MEFTLLESKPPLPDMPSHAVPQQAPLQVAELVEAKQRAVTGEAENYLILLHLICAVLAYRCSGLLGLALRPGKGRR